MLYGGIGSSGVCDEEGGKGEKKNLRLLDQVRNKDFYSNLMSPNMNYISMRAFVRKI